MSSPPYPFSGRAVNPRSPPNVVPTASLVQMSAGMSLRTFATQGGHGLPPAYPHQPGLNSAQQQQQQQQQQLAFNYHMQQQQQQQQHHHPAGMSPPHPVSLPSSCQQQAVSGPPPPIAVNPAVPGMQPHGSSCSEPGVLSPHNQHRLHQTLPSPTTLSPNGTSHHHHQMGIPPGPPHLYRQNPAIYHQYHPSHHLHQPGISTLTPPTHSSPPSSPTGHAMGSPSSFHPSASPRVGPATFDPGQAVGYGGIPASSPSGRVGGAFPNGHMFSPPVRAAGATAAPVKNGQPEPGGIYSHGYKPPGMGEGGLWSSAQSPAGFEAGRFEDTHRQQYNGTGPERVDHFLGPGPDGHAGKLAVPRRHDRRQDHM
ncbi:hypothetical protein ElyMa_005313900 [Elysia marginata]|uniref:Uncharacterized protein n=1 Tax=Elysia marginata TaxID=1093978 RepID=A0AAV4JYJ7_9GAST|nr:hypothetical protein ElyMa_005313900 [Elysia marginata]